jgi:2-iminobutanoate/2-iminopropanoate deaminase
VGKRHVIHVPGVEHKAPIPAGVLIGGLLFSSAINGKDPASGQYPDDAGEQMRLAFANMATLVREAGGDVDDIAHVTVFLQDLSAKKLLDEHWLTMFPDPSDRPARHAVKVDRAGSMLVQLEIIAVLSERTSTP